MVPVLRTDARLSRGDVSRELQFRRPHHLVILVVLVLILTVVILFTSQKLTIGGLLAHWFSGQEVQFNVPRGPVITLNGETTVSPDQVTICNRSDKSWNGLTIRVTSRTIVAGEPIELPLFAKVRQIDVGACVSIPNTKFFSPGWKKIPASSNLNIVRVEVLASVTGLGYFAREVNSANGR